MGAAQLSIDASSTDPDVQEDIDDAGAGHMSEVIGYLEFHAVLGLRYRATHSTASHSTDPCTPGYG